MLTLVMPKSKSISKEFGNTLKVSGYKGGIVGFAQEFLSMNKDAIYYQLREHGGFNDEQSEFIVDALKEGQHKKYGFKDKALKHLEKFLTKTIPRNESINVQGDNIAINQSSVNVQTSTDINYRDLYEKLKRESVEKDKKILILETKLDAYKDLLNERKKKD